MKKIISLVLSLFVAHFSIGAWIDHSFGMLENSHADYYYSAEHGWIYTQSDLSLESDFWFYDFSYGLGWQYFDSGASGFTYVGRLEAWVFLGGTENPGKWWYEDEWYETPDEEVFYVSSSEGLDTNEGTFENPFATIKKAFTVADAGDSIYVREGTYREELRPTRHGQPLFPLTLQAYEENGIPEEVVISVYDIANSSNGLDAWNDEGDGVYSIQLSTQFGSSAHKLLVKVDGELLVDARFPNADSSFDIFRDSMLSAESVSVVSENGADKTVRYHHPDLASFSTDDWAGSRIFKTQGKQWTPSDTIVTESDSDYVEFSYTLTDFGDQWNLASEGDIFYLMGRKIAMDQAGEFFHDVSGRDGPARMLYVKFPQGKTPSNSTVEIKRRTVGLFIPIFDYWVFKNLIMDGGTLQTAALTDNIIFDGITVKDFYLRTTGIPAPVQLEGENHIFKNGLIDQSTKNGIIIDGFDITFENNIIGRIFLNGLSGNGGRILAQNNTIFDCGGACVNFGLKNSKYLRNRAYHAGLYITDISIFNSWGSGGLDGSELAYNMVHDNKAVFDHDRPKGWNGGQGIRTDSGGGSGVSDVDIHHNIVWNAEQEGLSIWGLESAQPNVGDAKMDWYNNTTEHGMRVLANPSTRDGAGIAVENNYADETDLGRDPDVVSGNNFDLLSGDPRFFSVESADYRPLIDSPLYNDEINYIGAIAPETVFPVAGVIWREPDTTQLIARFVEGFDDISAVGVSGMPNHTHLPEGTMIRLDGTSETNDLYHRYNVDTHSAEGVFLLQYFETPSPVSVEISFDGGVTWEALNDVELEEGETRPIAPPIAVIYEGFTDYSSPLNQQNGGKGWSGGWSDNPASGGSVSEINSTATIALGNLAAPLDYVYRSESISDEVDEGSHVSELEANMIRIFSNPIDMFTDDVTYFSFLWSESSSAAGGVIEIEFLSSDTHSRRIWEMNTSSGEMSLSFGNGSSMAAGVIAFESPKVYLCVGKVEQSAGGSDRVSISLFESGTTIGAEPVTWDLSGEITNDVDKDRSINRLFVKGSLNVEKFDEFIVGKSFYDVTGVVDP